MFFFHKSFICTRLQTKIVYSLSLLSNRILKSKWWKLWPGAPLEVVGLGSGGIGCTLEDGGSSPNETFTEGEGFAPANDGGCSASAKSYAHMSAIRLISGDGGMSATGDGWGLSA